LTSFCPVNATWSIVAVDRVTGQVGGASATCRNSAENGGSVYDNFRSVTGVGALVGQAFSSESDRDDAQEEMKSCKDPNDIIKRKNAFVWPDEQWGAVTLKDKKKAYTGFVLPNRPDSESGDIEGSIDGYTYSIQGNRLTSQDVLKNVEKEFRAKGKECSGGIGRGQLKGGAKKSKKSSSRCDNLADRLMRAIEAGAKDGNGDSRCKIENNRPEAANTAYIKVVDPDAGVPDFFINVYYEKERDAIAELRNDYDAEIRTCACTERETSYDFCKENKDAKPDPCPCVN